MRKLVIAALLFSAGAMTAFSQEEKNELAGTIGKSIIGDQVTPDTSTPFHTVHFGHGISFDANYSRRLRKYFWGELSAEVPVIVTALAPVVAVALAVNVTVVPVAELVGLNDAVTPLGRPDAEKLTLPLKPFVSVTLTELDALLA